MKKKEKLKAVNLTNVTPNTFQISANQIAVNFNNGSSNGPYNKPACTSVKTNRGTLLNPCLRSWDVSCNGVIVWQGAIFTDLECLKGVGEILQMLYT